MYRYEEERQQHIAQYGSFLFCPEHGNLCSFMEETWNTGCGCGRTPCIIDDPEDIELKKRQAENRRKRDAEEKLRREAEKKEPPAPIRRQTKSWRDIQVERIQRLEEESEQAYRRNRPRIGEEKLHQAIILRRQLRRKENIDV